MRFKTVKLAAIRNDRLWLLLMVSEPDIGWCANEDARSPRRVDCEIPVGEWNEAFLVRVWKPLPSRRVLKL